MTSNNPEENNSSTEASNSSLFLDEEDEEYGYAVLNVHKNCFVSIPDAETGIMTPTNIVNNPDEDLLERVAENAGLSSVSHLRVVKVTLANELDDKAAEKVEKATA